MQVRNDVWWHPGKKQVWHPHVRFCGRYEANALYWRKHLWLFGAQGIVPPPRYIPKFITTPLTVHHPCLGVTLSDLAFSHHWLLSLTWCPLKNFARNSMGSTKVLPIGPYTCKDSPVHICIISIKLCHEFAFNFSKKSHE